LLDIINGQLGELQRQLLRLAALQLLDIVNGQLGELQRQFLRLAALQLLDIVNGQLGELQRQFLRLARLHLHGGGPRPELRGIVNHWKLGTCAAACGTAPRLACRPALPACRMPP